MASVLADFVRTSNERPMWEQTTLPNLRGAATAPRDHASRAILATHAWNMALALLEHRRAREPSTLSPADREKAQWLLEVALRTARQVDGHAPYMRVRYPILRSIMASGGRPWVERGR